MTREETLASLRAALGLAGADEELLADADLIASELAEALQKLEALTTGEG